MITQCAETRISRHCRLQCIHGAGWLRYRADWVAHGAVRHPLGARPCVN
jgi:hypothetical protein